MVTIVSTGIAGCGEKEYFDKFIDYCYSKGKRANIISVTDVVLEVAKKNSGGSK